jgi:hypothetical protein
MKTTPKKRAVDNYRQRLDQRGMARFEVLGLNADRDLIRSLAKRLAADDPDSARIRATVRRTVSGEEPRKGGILSALRRSPLVGADLDIGRYQHHRQRHQTPAAGNAAGMDGGPG